MQTRTKVTCSGGHSRNADKLNKSVMAVAPFMIDDTHIGIESVVLCVESYRSRVIAVATKPGDLVKSATNVDKATCKPRSDDANMFPSFVS